MKTINYSIISIGLLVFTFCISCNKEEEYSDIIYKNYLHYEIDQALETISITVEGDKEGEYKPGSKQAYLTVIDKAREVDSSNSVTQDEIDNIYGKLLKAGQTYFDNMIPFRSLFQTIIDYADYIYANTQEGSDQGNVPTGIKPILKQAIDDSKIVIAKIDLTETELEATAEDLFQAISSFNSSIIGDATIAILNPGFEEPGNATDNFGLVNGWSEYGNEVNPAYKTEVVLNDTTAPEGQYTAKIGSYTKGIYQNLNELLQFNSEYELSVKVSLLSNEKDWVGATHPVVVLTRFIVFNGKPGDYDFASVISAQYDTLGKSPTKFIEIKHTLKTGTSSQFIGKKLAIDIIQRHTWDAENPIWAESYVAIDDFKLSRK